MATKHEQINFVLMREMYETVRCVLKDKIRELKDSNDWSHAELYDIRLARLERAFREVCAYMDEPLDNDRLNTETRYDAI